MGSIHADFDIARRAAPILAPLDRRTRCHRPPNPYYQALDLLDVLDVPLPPPSGPVGIITRTARAGAPALDDLIEALRDSGHELGDK